MFLDDEDDLEIGFNAAIENKGVEEQAQNRKQKILEDRLFWSLLVVQTPYVAVYNNTSDELCRAGVHFTQQNIEDMNHLVSIIQSESHDIAENPESANSLSLKIQGQCSSVKNHQLRSFVEQVLMMNYCTIAVSSSEMKHMLSEKLNIIARIGEYLSSDMILKVIPRILKEESDIEQDRAIKKIYMTSITHIYLVVAQILLVLHFETEDSLIQSSIIDCLRPLVLISYEFWKKEKIYDFQLDDTSSYSNKLFGVLYLTNLALQNKDPQKNLAMDTSFHDLLTSPSKEAPGCYLEAALLAQCLSMLMNKEVLFEAKLNSLIYKIIHKSSETDLKAFIKMAFISDSGYNVSWLFEYCITMFQAKSVDQDHAVVVANGSQLESTYLYY